MIKLTENKYIFEISISNPKLRNALNYEMWLELADIADFCQKKSDMRLLVIRGHGEEAFASGADISEFSSMRCNAEKAQVYDDAVDLALNRIMHIDRPVISKITGACFGGGLALALATDIRFACDNAFFCLPAARLGLGYHLNWLTRMVEILGESTALDLLYSGRRVEAKEAFSIGLATKVASIETFEDTFQHYCDAIVNNAPMVLRAAKKGIIALRCHEEAMIQQANYLVKNCSDSADYMEGIAAYQARRKPEFKGR